MAVTSPEQLARNLSGGTQQKAVVAKWLQTHARVLLLAEPSLTIQRVVQLTFANEDLDACHGHEHVVDWDGAPLKIYHYHTTSGVPYISGCFAGTPGTVTGG